VAAAKNRDEQPFDDLFLANDDAGELLPHFSRDRTEPVNGGDVV
jgi:hypothetical protein